ncbi:hypothetical protein BCR43DRAFT_516013 [Syncephalastrum racemosum]|uniref:MARVEL domain-containing protein n=1 Tax=Syncephalastrum racemosum TaxID=13706 RepID=A0A1X2HCL7_SYNRA|nr:hypothetical protein BCR43DRAFT_516013 [Syncephalastrum racemosum]
MNPFEKSNSALPSNNVYNEKTLIESPKSYTPPPSPPALSPLPPPSIQASHPPPSMKPSQTEPCEKPVHGTQRPSPIRLGMRVWQLLAALGAFAFQAGASPYAMRPMPFSENMALVYFVYALFWISFTWSLFEIYVYLTRLRGRGGKVKRIIAFAVDAILAALMGVGVCYEIALYKCPPGQYDGWCDFFNTGLFFGVSLFSTYILTALWDLFGGLTCIRQEIQEP